MPVTFVCAKCGYQREVAEQYAGRTFTCPACQAKGDVPHDATQASATETGCPSCLTTFCSTAQVGEEAVCPTCGFSGTVQAPQATANQVTPATEAYCATCGNLMLLPSPAEGSRWKCLQCGKTSVVSILTVSHDGRHIASLTKAAAWDKQRSNEKAALVGLILLAVLVVGIPLLLFVVFGCDGDDNRSRGQWNEADHPRDEKGRFVPKPGKK